MSSEKNSFVPRGAFAFFGLLLILCALIWLGIFDILISRA